MRFTEVKKDSDVALAGIKAEIHWKDKEPSEITLTDGEGRCVRIVRDQYGRLDILVPAPPEKVTKYRVRGRFADAVDIDESYEDKFDADRRRDELEAKDPGFSKSTIEVDQVEELVTA